MAAVDDWIAGGFAVPVSSSNLLKITYLRNSSSSVSPSTVGIGPLGADCLMNTVTITTVLPHNFILGKIVNIIGVVNSKYNGSFFIDNILSATSFAYTALSSHMPPSGGGTATSDAPVVTHANIGELTVQFKKPTQNIAFPSYTYYDVPEAVARGLYLAGSKGTYLDLHVKKAGYRYSGPF